MDRATAFRRAQSYLNTSLLAKWAALLSAVVTGLLFAALLLLLYLFADLLATRGKVPSSYEATESLRRVIETRDWPALPIEDRLTALEQVDVPVQRRRAVADADPADSAPDERQARWAAGVRLLLAKSVRPAAADAYLPIDPEARPVDRLALTHRPLGILGLVVRSRDTWSFPLVAGFASWNRWSWDSVLGSSPDQSYLLGLVLLAGVVISVRAVFMNLNNYAAAVATLEAITRLRRQVYLHTSRLGTLAVRSYGPGEAASLFVRRMESLHDALYESLTVAVREPFKFMLVLALAFALNIWLTLAAILFAVLVWLVGGQVLSRYRRRGRAANRKSATQLALLQESVSLMRLVRCYLMDAYNQNRVERQLGEYARSHMRRFSSEAVSRPLVVFLGSIGAVLLLFVAGKIVLAEQLRLATLVTLATALVSLYFPLESWLARRVAALRGRDAAADIFEFLDRKSEVSQELGADFLPGLTKQLEFDDVSLRDSATGRLMLQKITFKLKAGERIGLVGPDDAEKHALVYLIPRFLDPTNGEIKIDGQNLRWVTLDSLRAQIGMVMQNNLIFNDTVANNIGCGDPAYTLPQIIEAAKLAHAHQFILKLPQGYETPVGELVHPLKASEQFRIAVARAILRDPALWIIEEPVTAFDDDTKALLDDTFDRILTGKATIFLPHRASTIKSCDRLLLVHRGRIEAVGEHRDLFHSSELYKHLHYLEFNPFADHH